MRSARRITFTCGVRFMRFMSASVRGCASGSLRAAASTCSSVIASNARQSVFRSGRSFSFDATRRRASASSARSPPSPNLLTAALHSTSASSKNFNISIHLSMVTSFLLCSTSQAHMFSRASAAMISPTSATISRLPRQLWMSGSTHNTTWLFIGELLVLAKCAPSPYSCCVQMTIVSGPSRRPPSISDRNVRRSRCQSSG